MLSDRSQQWALKLSIITKTLWKTCFKRNMQWIQWLLTESCANSKEVLKKLDILLLLPRHDTEPKCFCSRACFILFRKSQYHSTFQSTYRGVFIIHSTVYDWGFLQKQLTAKNRQLFSQRSSIAGVRLGSKYVSDLKHCVTLLCVGDAVRFLVNVTNIWILGINFVNEKSETPRMKQVRIFWLSRSLSR